MSLHDLFEKYQGQVQFLLVYIREAHPTDGWWLGGGLPSLGLKLIGSKAATDVKDPTTFEERQFVAKRCSTTLKYEIPVLVDGIDDAVNRAYVALPTRLYLVGQDGKIAYAGRPGPFGFKPGELGEAIERYLAQRM